MDAAQVQETLIEAEMNEVVFLDVERVVGLIERYLARHPEASDNTEGVVRWWLARQCYEEAQALAEEALAEAVRRGLLKTRIGPGNEPSYHRAERPNVTNTDAEGDR